MKIQIGTFAKDFNQANIFKLVFKNENGTAYSIKLPFRRFLLVTIEK
jgi:hypothetical protein